MKQTNENVLFGKTILEGIVLEYLLVHMFLYVQQFYLCLIYICLIIKLMIIWNIMLNWALAIRNMINIFYFNFKLLSIKYSHK